MKRGLVCLVCAYIYILWVNSYLGHDEWVPVSTTRRVLRLRMKERPPDMEGSSEYIE
jgi:hypothetical protein